MRSTLLILSAITAAAAEIPPPVRARLEASLPVPVFECTAEERQRGRYIHGASPVVLCAL